ncbi:hypothetical protein EET67_04895 [Pseudaminobacter arsenicus]|uniref:Uncharacterized protein n=1 Tax=Borborobacter arsenicus TaxID=1851146 RepID=A0A432V9X4_9HYPH|nr:hypothetical protein [Pseudaminobacter arsenicus]RUM98981.1 hypothetical protein EET67_04895 [Pseudaminobacter arsenicus]
MADTARDVIARALFETALEYPGIAPWDQQYEGVKEGWRERADRLIAAGYRILPGELDGESLEAAAKVADKAAKNCNWTDGVIEARNIAAATRSLKGGRNA